ncbi:uncharacterized protein LOC132743931 [Ruditapes philippinarum]|uniref:uncharacterized protein LOC132743931 n=1 Tax=Ruditapes philippinarum TaxID=129788 RepID=UPI00295A7CA1|nr:uncharacterized protein LOC132743931 [Ruditapes philippinarum]
MYMYTNCACTPYLNPKVEKREGCFYLHHVMNVFESLFKAGNSTSWSVQYFISKMDTSSPYPGNFRKRILTPSEITIKDLYNPWNFFTLFNQDDQDLNEWLMANQFLVRTMPCTKTSEGCTGIMKGSQRKGRISGPTVRCSVNRNHEVAIRTFSFFEGSKLCVQDIFMFIRCYLNGMTLLQTSIFAGVNYKSTALDWASFLRELFKEHFHRNISHRKLRGEIAIDESLFGRRVKYHRGNPHKGLKVMFISIK